jgi:hypothetical protein
MVALLLAIATFCLALGTLAMFGIIGLGHAHAWLGLGLTVWCLATLLGAAAPYLPSRG